MRAVGYIRVNTAAERETAGAAFNVQRKAIEKHAAAAGCELVNVYADVGAAADIGDKEFNVSRPELDVMLDAVKAGGIDTVIVSERERLARDVFAAYWIEGFIIGHGASLCVVNQNYGDYGARAGMLRDTVTAFVEIDNLAPGERIKSGRLRKAQAGEFPGGRVPLGYNAVGGCLEIDAAEAETVRRIFELRRSGNSLAAIVGILTDEDRKTKCGGTWAAATVKAILDNPIYQGKIRYNGVEADGIHPAICAASNE